MSNQNQRPALAVVSQMEKAINDHDIEAFVDCFAQDFVSEQPVHPGMNFTGTEKVRQNWTGLFANVPDLRARLVATAEADGVVWAEWHWQGRQASGADLEMRGVTLSGVRDGKIAWSRLYMEPVQNAPAPQK